MGSTLVAKTDLGVEIWRTVKVIDHYETPEMLDLLIKRRLMWVPEWWEHLPVEML